MYLTNNKKTIYNIILYSMGIYTKRNLLFIDHNYHWSKLYYCGVEPYGNIGVGVQIYYRDIELDYRNNIKE